MIYSASRRTDMPAFFPDLVAEKVRRSRKLEGIVFWTKDIRNLVNHPDLSRIVVEIPSIIQYTVTGLAGTVWEPNVPPLDKQTDELSQLAARLPRGVICWRFDPIVPSPDVLDRFARTKALLEKSLGYGLEYVTVSFPDPYHHAVARSVKAGMQWPTINLEEKKRIIAAMVQSFHPHPNPVRLCCEPDLLTQPGVSQSRCMDGRLFAQLYNLPLADLPKDKGQRVPCGCVQSTDIGEYAQACRHGCVYCYARPEEN